MIKLGKFIIDLRPENNGLFTFEFSQGKQSFELHGNLETIENQLKHLETIEQTTRENLLKGFNHLKNGL